MTESAAAPPASAETSTVPQMTVNEHKAVIQFNRPRQHNRFEPVDIATLMELFDAIDRDLSIRVLVITATGPTFSSGYDIGSLVSGSGTKKHANNHEFSALCDRPMAPPRPNDMCPYRQRVRRRYRFCSCLRFPDRRGKHTDVHAGEWAWTSLLLWRPKSRSGNFLNRMNRM